MNRLQRYIVLFVVSVCSWTGILSAETSVSELFDVAPDLKETVFQKWPRSAWSAGAQCWLVVWREGDLNRQETDIWCARVAADGKSMDPAGIRITSSEDIADRPVVASDGKDFLVVWQSLSNGNDTVTGEVQGWDVRAARVSADGKVSEPDGFVVSGGGHNQCLPTVTFSGQNYYLAWQSWVEDAIVENYGSYRIRGARVSPGGKLLDVDGIELIAPTAIQPTLAYHPEGGLVLVCHGRVEKKKFGSGFDNKPGFLRIDPEKGTPVGTVSYLPRNFFTWESNRAPGVAVMKDGTSLVNVVGYRGGMTLFRYDKDGKRIGEWQRFRKDLQNQCMVTIPSMATDGEKTLMTFDFPTKHKSIAKIRGRICMKVWGWMLSPDGTIFEGGQSGFSIANKDTMDSVQGYPCAGPSGTFLVVCGEMRDENYTTRVVGRLVK